MADVLEYDNIFKEDKGTLNPGKFKATSSGVAFKSSKTGRVDNIQANDIRSVSWQRLAASHGIRITSKNGFFRFGGFRETDLEKFSGFFKENYDQVLTEKDFSLKGWNWGVTNFQGTVLDFSVDNHPAFEVPLSNVSHCVGNKNEVTLEFHQNDDASVALMEMRFHIPSDNNSQEDPVQSFLESVLAKADIIQATGDAICTFPELHCLTPRGRYDVKLFPSFIQLHGKTFDYKIPLQTILRLFRLPHKDGRQAYFVMSLDPPIKHGQTRYPFVILNFNIEEETTVELNIPEDAADKFSSVENIMEGVTIDILGKVMKCLVQRKITVPIEYPSKSGPKQPIITCSYKSNSGIMYLLERGIIYIHKPPLHIRCEEVATVSFERGDSTTRSFDLVIETKNSAQHTFSSIAKEEYSRVYDFVMGKNLKVKNVTGSGSNQNMNNDLVDSDDENNGHDAYLDRVKREGRERVEADSDESDEDFNPEKQAASGSDDDGDVAEEFDSDAPDSDDDASGGDDDEETPKKKMKTKSKEKKERKSSKPKTSKAKKDPNAPKKPMSSYFLWLNDSREKIKSDNPGIGIQDIARKAGEMWKSVDMSDKAEYEEKAMEAKRKYKVDMEAYEAAGGGKNLGGDDDDGSGDEVKEKKKPKKKSSTSKATISPKKQSGEFKSKEYIDDSDSDSDSESDDSKKKKKKNKEKEKKKPDSEEEDSSE